MRDHPTSVPAAPLTLVRTWSRTFPATPSQVPSARRFLTGLLTGFPAAGDAAVCVSELVHGSPAQTPAGCAGAG